MACDSVEVRGGWPNWAHVKVKRKMGLSRLSRWSSVSFSLSHTHIQSGDSVRVQCSLYTSQRSDILAAQSLKWHLLLFLKTFIVLKKQKHKCRHFVHIQNAFIVNLPYRSRFLVTTTKYSLWARSGPCALQCSPWTCAAHKGKKTMTNQNSIKSRKVKLWEKHHLGTFPLSGVVPSGWVQMHRYSGLVPCIAFV